MKNLLLAAAALTIALPAIAQDADAASSDAEPAAQPLRSAPSPGEIVEQAAPAEWIGIAPEDLLVMSLDADRDGNPREVVIQLLPPPFSQGWVENIKTLARSGWYDDTAVIRVQDNYVVQWGDPAEEEAEAKPLPDGLKVMDDIESPYLTFVSHEVPVASLVEYMPLKGIRYHRQRGEAVDDPYNRRGKVGWLSGVPIGLMGRDQLWAWPVHCYGMVGVGRGMSPNTGDGSSLYTVIGHAPRHLDRNIALVGRIIEGMEHLSSLPRGHGPLGFYAEDELDKRTGILRVRIASDLPDDDQPRFQFLSTESETFARYAEARANRRDPFFIKPAGGADICNIPVPLRRAPEE